MKRHLSILTTLGIFGCEYSGTIQKTESDVRAMTVDLSDLQAEIGRLKTQVEANRLATANRQEDVSALWSVVSENEDRIDELESTVINGIGSGSLSELATRVDEMETSIETAVRTTSTTAALA